MEQFLSWFVLPLLFAAIALGYGLLAERIARVTLPGGMVLPVGFAVSVVVGALPYDAGLGAPFGAALLLIGAALGLIVGRRRLLGWRHADLVTTAAALGVYLVYLVPVAFTGHVTFGGYGFLGDNSVHFSMVDYVAKHGASKVSLAPSSFKQVTYSLLDSGYPLGLHYQLASLRLVLGQEVSHFYQAYLAAIVPLAVFPAASLLRRAGMPRLLAAGGAFVAVCAYLPFSYALEGSVKEMAMIVFVLLGAALAVELTTHSRPLSIAGLIGLVTAAAFRVYSAGGLPWFALMVAAVLLVALIWDRRPWRSLAVPVAVMAGLFALGILPGLAQVSRFSSAVKPLLGKGQPDVGGTLGNLLGPLRFVESLGTWFVSDFRLTPTNPELTWTIIGVTAALALAGTIAAVRRGSLGVLLALFSSLIVWKLLPAGPWIEAKLLVILSPSLLLIAMVGAWALAKGGNAVAAGLLALAVSAGVLASDAIAYHGYYIAPQPRLNELASINKRFSGQGPTLLNEFEEYGKHFLRDVKVNEAYGGYAAPSPPLRHPLPAYAHYYDLDELDAGFVQSYDLIVSRRSPAASRPPAPFSKVWSGRYYEVWKRTAGGRASEHLPLGGTLATSLDATGRARCADVRKLASHAAAAGEELVAAERPDVRGLPVRDMAHPPGWPLDADKRVIPNTPGRVISNVGAAPGTYRVWVRGTFGRGLDVYLDGRRVGHASQLQTPGQMALTGTVSVDGNRHQLVMIRGGGSLAPGNATGEAYDAVFLEPVTAAERLVQVPPSQARSLCGGRFDWVESAPAGAVSR